MPDKPPPTKVKIPLGQRKSGLAVPADQVDICKHGDIVQRIKPTFDRFVCGDCKEKIVLVPIQMKLMSEPEFDALQMAQVLQQRAAQRKKVGLITPDEARQQ